MSRIDSNFTPTELASHLLDGVKRSMGMVPNIYKLMALSPEVLEAHLSFISALDRGSLSNQERAHIALVVAGHNKCEYCASAHTLMAEEIGISVEEIRENIKGTSENTKIKSLMKFCIVILDKKGSVSDEELEEIRQAGFSDKEIIEIIANVSINIFTNYFNHVAKTDLDFPEVNLD